MHETELHQRLAACLIVSLLIHLGMVLALTDTFRPRQAVRRLPGQSTVLSVEFKTLHLAEKDRQNQFSPPVRVGTAGGRSRAQPKPPPIFTGHVDSSQRHAIKAAPQTARPGNPSPAEPAPPKLELSKVLNDMRQVARESAEHAGEQKFDRRKWAVNPENLKAPASRPAAETETYTLANGYQRRCVTDADGKQQCMRKEADDDSIWNAKIYLPDSLPSANKSSEFARRLQQAIGKH